MMGGSRGVLIRQAAVAGALALALTLVCAVGAFAHGTGFTRYDSPDVVALSFFYATGEPMAYGAVKVFAPGGGEVEFQNARTDRRGGFAFLPDQPGPWTVHVTDGRGHAVNAEVTVGGVSQEKTVLEGTRRIPPLMGALFGVSLLGNAFLVHRQRKGGIKGP